MSSVHDQMAAAHAPPAETTRERILRAATGLFASQGIGRTSVREIAAAAGVNLALVSHHFGGKEKLYAACVEAMYAELDGMRSELLTALNHGDSLADTVAHAVAHGFHYAREHRGAVQLVMRHVLDTGEVPAERRDTLLLPFLDAAALALSEPCGRSPGEVRIIIQSLLFLMTRYALSSVEELALVTGMTRPGRNASEPDALILREVENHLRKQALWLFGLSS